MEHILHLKDALNWSSSLIHCVAQKGNLYDLIWKRIFFTVWHEKRNGLVYLGSDHRLYKIQNYEVLWEHLLRNNSFISFFFASVVPSIWSKWSFTNNKYSQFFVAFFQAGESKRKRERAKERFAFSNCFLCATLAPLVRHALCLASLKNPYATKTPVLQSTLSYVKGIHGYCSCSLVMSRYPTNHTIYAFKTIRSKLSQKVARSGASTLWLMCSVEI